MMTKLWDIQDMMNIKMKINMKESTNRLLLEIAIAKIKEFQGIKYHRRIRMPKYNEAVQKADMLAMLLIKI